MRIMDSAPGVALADALGLGRAAKRRRYALLVCSTFFFSGITHMGLVPPAPLWSNTPPNRLRVQVAGFFWVQAVGILGEAVVEEAVFGRRVREADGRGGGGMVWKVLLARAVRLVWVVAWLALSLRLLVVPARELGLWYLWPPVLKVLPRLVKDALGSRD